MKISKNSSKSTKTISRSKLVKELDTIAKNAAKERDGYICQKCGLKLSGSNCHGSHVIPVSAGLKLRWDLNNIKTLCYHCHMNWWHKNPLEAAEWFRGKFPERAKYLEENKGIKPYKIWELEDLLKTMKGKK